MKLAMPYDGRRGKVPLSRKIQRVGNDIQIDAKDFQVNLTLLCLALGRQDRGWDPSFRPMCRVMLETARRYDILRRFQGRVGTGAENGPMSALIFADICARDLKRKAQIPAIVANCCNYKIRIDTRCEASCGLSLSLTLLAMFLLNGEMLAYHSLDKDIGTMTMTNFLMHHSVGQFNLPVPSK